MELSLESIHDNSKWDNISEGIVKSPYLDHSETLFETLKYNGKPNPLIQTVVHRPNLNYSKYTKNINDFFKKEKDRSDLPDT